jgi:hypothetical protein
MSPAMLAVTGKGTRASSAGFAAALVTVFALGAYLLVAHRRQRSVLLYEQGVAVQTKRSRTITRFEDVDELWLDVDAAKGTGPRDDTATLRAIRPKEHGGRWQTIPLHVERGESLAFGAVHLNITEIGADGWTINWSELSRVSVRRTRIDLFRRQSQQLVPWRTVSISEVPHPTIFAACVIRCTEAIASDVATGAGGAWLV